MHFSRLLVFFTVIAAALSACAPTAPSGTLPLAKDRSTLLFFFTDN